MFNLRNVNLRGTKTNNVLKCINSIVILMSIIALGIDWNEDCDFPFKAWLIVAVLRIGFDLWWTIKKERRDNVAQEEAESDKWAEAMGIFSFIWLILGSSWSTNSQTCAAKMPFVFWCSVGIVLYTWFIMLFPVILALLIFPFFLLCLPCYIRRLRRQGTGEISLTDLTQEPIITPEIINSWPLLPFDTDEITSTESTCAICLVDFEKGEKIKELPCSGKHIFHPACIGEWLAVKSTCPCCREDLAPFTDVEHP